MNDRRVPSRREGLASAPRAPQSAVSTFGAPISEETRRLAQAIHLVASPGPNVARTHDQMLRVAVWIACLLACGLVWATVAYVAAGAQPW
jgi:hypothetical protein